MVYDQARVLRFAISLVDRNAFLCYDSKTCAYIEEQAVMNNREIALDMVDMCRSDYQNYLGLRSNTTEVPEAAVAKDLVIKTSSALLAHLFVSFPNPMEMDSTQYEATKQEIREMLLGGDIEDISDATFPVYIVRLVLRDHRITPFVRSIEWQKYIDLYIHLIMGDSYTEATRRIHVVRHIQGG